MQPVVKDPKVKALLLKLADAPNQTIFYHGSGVGDALRARLVSAGWIERATFGRRETLCLSDLGRAVVRLLKEHG